MNKRGMLLIGILLILTPIAAGLERGEYWNRHDKGPGTYNLEVYSGIVNYDSGSGYEPFELTLNTSGCEASYDYCLNGSFYEAHFKTNVDWGVPVMFIKDSYDITYGPEEMSYGNTWGVEADYIGSLQSVTGTANGSSFNYSGAFDSTDLIYTYTPTQLKEIFVLKSMPSPPSSGALNGGNVTLDYSFTLDYNANLNIYVNGTNEEGNTFETYEDVEFRNSSGDVIFYFPKPYAYDSNGEGINIKYYIRKSGSQVYAYIQTNYTWLNASDRAFPVYIDPSTRINVSEGGADVYVDKSTPDRNHGDKDYLKVQRVTWQRAYLMFNISSIPDNQIIDNASLCLYMYNDQGDNNLSVNHVYDDSWCEGDGGTDGSPSCEITWNNQPCGTEEESLNASFCNTTAEDILENDGSLDDTWQCWSVRDMIDTEYSSDNESVSMVIWTVDSGNADIFHTKEYTDSSLWPYLNITYHTANSAPSINLLAPENEATYGYNESIDLEFSVNDSDSNLESCWYSIDGGNNTTITNCQNTTFNVSGNGGYSLTIYANDSFGEEGYDSVNFSVQLGAPSIVLHFPVDVYLADREVQFNYTPTDVDLDSCELWLGDPLDLNQTDLSPVSASINHFYLNLSDGNYKWNVRCNDSSANSAFDGNKTFYVDTTSPSLSLSQPSGKKTSKDIAAAWSVVDNSSMTCWYNVYRGASLEVANTTVNCTPPTTSFSVSSDGSFVFNFYVNDSAGNMNYSNLSFTVDTYVPPSTDGGGGGGGGGGGILKIYRMEISNISDIIVDPGENKRLVLRVKNTGTMFLNECRLKALGENSGWISSSEVKGLGAGESYEFTFSLSVPENLNATSYSIFLSVVCEEANASTSFNAEVIEKKLSVGLVTIEKINGNNKLRIIYSLSELSDINQEVDVEISLVNEEGEKVVEFEDSKVINAGSSQNFEVTLESETPLIGNYNLLINALSETSSAFYQEEIVLGDSKIGGLAILDDSQRNFVLSAIIIGIFVVFALFIVIRIWRFRGFRKRTKIKRVKH